MSLSWMDARTSRQRKRRHIWASRVGTPMSPTLYASLASHAGRLRLLFLL